MLNYFKDKCGIVFFFPLEILLVSQIFFAFYISGMTYSFFCLSMYRIPLQIQRTQIDLNFDKCIFKRIYKTGKG